MDKQEECNKLLSELGWGLRRHKPNEIVVTNKDGSGVVLFNNNESSIAESLFYRMMDEFLTTT